MGFQPNQRVIVLGLLFALVGCNSHERVPVPGTVAGSYELLLCRDGCVPGDTIRPYVTGLLVLSDSSIILHGLPDSTRKGLAGHATFYYEPLDSANACFVRRGYREQGDSYAGNESVVLMRWRRDSVGVLHMALYYSPDAGYTLTLRPVRDGWSGAGTSYGAGVAEIHAPLDSIVARRIGRPDVVPCLVAALR